MIFRRTSPSDARPNPVTAFWSWWQEDGHSLDPSRASAATDELNDRIMAINSDLTWHFGPGETSRHRLTVSAGGVAAVRPWAERWLRAAPSPDPTWEFASSVASEPDVMTRRLKIHDQDLDLSQTVFGVDVDDERLWVHVTVHHPTFDALDEPERMQIAFMVVDWLLGEDDVERWVGAIGDAVERPAEAVSDAELIAAVRSVAAKREHDGWALGEWTRDDGCLGLASFRIGMRWLDHPTLDRHQSVALPYAPNELGLPAHLDAVRAVEDDLLTMLGPRAVLVAHESCDGVRTFHLYTDSEDQNVDADLRRFVKSRGLRVAASDDPGWTQTRRFWG